MTLIRINCKLYDTYADPNGYKACTLFHQCLPQNCDIEQDNLLLPVNQKKCLTKEYLNKHECKDKDRIFQVSY